jgi:hypothetical protein
MMERLPPRLPQAAYKPDWTKHAKAAPFKRNDAILDVLPISVMVFLVTGIQARSRRQDPKASHRGLAVRHGWRVSAAAVIPTSGGRRKQPCSFATRTICRLFARGIRTSQEQRANQ